MRSKFLAVALIASLCSGVAFGADSKAVELSNEMFKFKKEASKEYLKIQDGCDKIHSKMVEATKDMNRAQRDEFFKEFRYQMRKNMATLSKDEEFYPGICGPRGSKKGGYYKNYRGGGYGGGYGCYNNADCPMNK